MKLFYTLSAVAIFNLFAVTTLANMPIKNQDSQLIAQTETTVPTPTPIIVIKKIVTKVKKRSTNAPVAVTNPTLNTQVASTIALSAPQPAPTQPPISGCIITLDGGSYDVTRLKSTHSGGDIFACGSDMSATFWSKHGQSIFNKMQQYRL